MATLPLTKLWTLWQVAPGCIVDEAVMERLGLLDIAMVALELPDWNRPPTSASLIVLLQSGQAAIGQMAKAKQIAFTKQELNEKVATLLHQQNRPCSLTNLLSQRLKQTRTFT